MIPFEEDNLAAYRLLIRIEIALRECLKRSMEAEFGPSWQKKLPGGLLKKIMESQTKEHRPQFNFIRLGPLYYLTFGELLTLLRQKAGSSVADKFGGECFLKQLENIFEPRNSLCHSRAVSSVGLKVIQTLYAEMETALTADGFMQLTSRPDTGLTQLEVAKAAIPLLTQVLHTLPELPAPLPFPEVLRTAMMQFWWIDDSLAGFNVARVEAALAFIQEYNSLPMGVGSAGKRQNCCERHGFQAIIKDAIAELEKVKQ